MKFFLALLVWFALIVVIGTGIVMTVKGKHFLFPADLLIISLFGYTAAFVKYGCLSH